MEGQGNGGAREWRGKGMEGQGNGGAREWEGRQNIPLSSHSFAPKFLCPFLPVLFPAGQDKRVWVVCGGG
jgi:hypothetical protein